MRTFDVLVWLATILRLGWADDPYSGLKVNIFNKENKMESTFHTAIEEIHGHFEEALSTGDTMDAGKSMIDVSTGFMGNIAPGFAIVYGLLSKFVDSTFENNKWKAAVEQMIDDKAILKSALDEFRLMRNQLKKIVEWVPYTFESNPSYERNVDYIYKGENELIGAFTDDSPFVQYPLIGAPFLIALSLAVATFEPKAAAVFPLEYKNFTLPCQVYDLLVDYRSYAVDDRLDKLKLPRNKLIDVRYEPYNPNGYTSTTFSNCKHDGSADKCVEDTFSTNKYCHNDEHCRIGYALHVRHEVEKIFPVEQLHAECKKEWPEREATGDGYLTIKFKQLTAVGTARNLSCDWWTSCDPYLKVFINGDEVFSPTIHNDTESYNVGRVFTSNEIQRNNAKIKFVVRDLEGDEDEPDDPDILNKEFTVEQFLKKDARIISLMIKLHFMDMADSMHANSLETSAFWKDIYNYIECSPQEGGNDSKKCTKSTLYQKNEYFEKLFGKA